MKVLNISSIRQGAPGHSEPFRIALYAGVLALAAILAVGLPMQLAGWSLAEENGPLEIKQMLVILAGAAIFFLSSAKREILAPVWAFSGLAYLTLALRELDLRNSIAPDWLVAATLDQRHVWLAPLFLIAAITIFRNRVRIAQEIKGRDWREPLMLLGTAAATYLISHGFEKKFFLADRPMAQFMEEALELSLAVFLAGLAFLCARTQALVKQQSLPATGNTSVA